MRRVTIIRIFIELKPIYRFYKTLSEFQKHYPQKYKKLSYNLYEIISSVQLLSHVQLFVTSWTEGCQVYLSITNSRSLLKLRSIESVMASNHLILCHPLILLPSIFNSIRVFSMSQFFTPGGQSIGVSASASVPPMNIQD